MQTANADRTGNFCGLGDGWTETYTGIAFNIADPQPEMFDIQDIAQGLSNVCRYGGQIEGDYKVAEHSCHVHDLLLPYGDDAAFAGLMHDAHEAYNGDALRPHKSRLGEYRADSARLQRIIEQLFGIDGWVYADIVKLADNSMLRTEARVLTYSGGTTWNWTDDHGQEVKAADCLIMCWPAPVAKANFMSRFNRHRGSGLG